MTHLNFRVHRGKPHVVLFHIPLRKMTLSMEIRNMHNKSEQTDRVIRGNYIT